MEEEKDAQKSSKLMHFEEVIRWLWKRISGVSEYTVVYKDWFVGMIECDLEVFLNNEDIPLHRAYTIKLDGKVVWDRKTKTNLLKF